MFRICWCAVLAAALVGCSSAEPKLYKVTGTVSWKGAPIANGRLNMLADDGQTPPATARIENGKFELRAAAGVKRVEVFNQKDKGFDKAMGAHVFVNDIPGEYNGETKLRFEVKPNDDNVLDLTLPQK
jgi:hypothetical protein